MNNIRDNSGQVVSRRSRSLGKAKSKRQNGSDLARPEREAESPLLDGTGYRH